MRETETVTILNDFISDYDLDYFPEVCACNICFIGTFPLIFYLSCQNKN